MSEAEIREATEAQKQAIASAQRFQREFERQSIQPTGRAPESVPHRKFEVSQLPRSPGGQFRPAPKRAKKQRQVSEGRRRRRGRPFTLKSLGGTGYYSPGPKYQRRRIGISGRTTTVIPGSDGEELLKLRKRAQIIEEKKELARLRKNDRFFYRQHPYYLSEAERMA